MCFRHSVLQTGTLKPQWLVYLSPGLIWKHYLCFFPRSVFMYQVQLAQPVAIISLNTNVSSVLWAVGTVFLYRMLTNFSLRGRALAHTVGGPCSIPGQSVWDLGVDKVALGYAFLKVFGFQSVSDIPPMLHVHFHLNNTITSKGGRPSNLS
jgi:hypothetical protein